jgi:hypothetical protein
MHMHIPNAVADLNVKSRIISDMTNVHWITKPSSASILAFGVKHCVSAAKHTGHDVLAWRRARCLAGVQGDWFLQTSPAVRTPAYLR